MSFNIKFGSIYHAEQEDILYDIIPFNNSIETNLQMKSYLIIRHKNGVTNKQSNILNDLRSLRFLMQSFNHLNFKIP